MKIKSKPEDFVVEEIPIPFSGSGPYTIVRVEKRLCNTEYAARTLERIYRVPRKNIGYAGMKDKIACTTQYMSVKGGNPRRFNDERVTAIPFTHHGSPITLGSLLGNKFIITIRELEKELLLVTQFPNYFGSQRFGGQNAVIGKALVKKDLKGVADLLHIEESDIVGEIKKLPTKTVLLYIHAYQSLLWNKVLSYLLSGSFSEELVRGDLKKLPAIIPLIGFGTELDKYDKKVQDAYKKLLAEEGVTPRDFIIKSLPHLSVEGDDRATVITVADLELGPYEENVQVISFTLPKGCYATTYLNYVG